jgi:hypothetical protein
MSNDSNILSMENHMNLFFRALLATAVAATALSVAAQTNTPRVDARQQNQAARIANGQATGQLSATEAARMNAGQTKVAGMEARAKADGKVTRAERARLNKAQNKQSRRIAKQKRDGNNK